MEPVKKTRVRRSKDRPPFYKTENNKEYTLSGFKIQNFSPPYSDPDLVMCPYTKYIPIPYLFVTKSEMGGFWEDSLTNHFKRYNPTLAVPKSPPGDLFKSLVYEGLKNGGPFGSPANIATREATKVIVEDVLAFDKRSSFHSLGFTHYTEQMIWAFKEQRIYNSQMRTYNVEIGSFCAVIFDPSLPVREQKIPHIMGVIKQEDYLYHKANTLLGIPLDLSRVVILVNRELDIPGSSPGIPNAFKAFYQKHLEPIILSTQAQIWKVPLDYIKDSCFISSFKPKSRMKVKKREEMNTFISRFYDKYEFKDPYIELTLEGIREGSISSIGPINPGTSGSSISYVTGTDPWHISNGASSSSYRIVDMSQDNREVSYGQVAMHGTPAPVFDQGLIDEMVAFNPSTEREVAYIDSPEGQEFLNNPVEEEVP